MKKLVLLSISLFFSFIAQAVDFTVDNLKYIVNNDGTTVSVPRQSGDLSGEIVIPSSVTVPSNLISMGQNAFDDCNSLNSIFLPSGVISIGNMVFNTCNMLREFTCLNPIPPEVVSNAFNGILLDS